MLDMDSMPPATTISAPPVWICWTPSMTAFKPEAQTLFTVVHTVVSWRPAPRAACLAGFCPTLLRIVSSHKRYKEEMG